MAFFKVRKCCLSKARDERGATMVENVVILPLFFAILVVSFDLLLMAVQVLTVRYTASRVVREASLGQLSPAEIRTTVQNFSGSLGTHIPDNYISMCRLEDFPCPTGSIATGSFSELIVLELRSPVRGILMGTIAKTNFGERVFDFRARAIARREP